MSAQLAPSSRKTSSKHLARRARQQANENYKQRLNLVELQFRASLTPTRVAEVVASLHGRDDYEILPLMDYVLAAAKESGATGISAWSYSPEAAKLVVLGKKGRAVEGLPEWLWKLVMEVEEDCWVPLRWEVLGRNRDGN